NGVSTVYSSALLSVALVFSIGELTPSGSDVISHGFQPVANNEMSLVTKRLLRNLSKKIEIIFWACPFLLTQCSPWSGRAFGTRHACAPGHFGLKQCLYPS